MSQATSPVILDTRVTYWVGSPILPVQPLDTISQSPEWWEPEFRGEIRELLREENVLVEVLALVKRVQKGKAVRATPETIMITSDVSMPVQYDNWKRAATRLRRLLDSVDRYDIAVEIIDYRGHTCQITAIPALNQYTLNRAFSSPIARYCRDLISVAAAAEPKIRNYSQHPVGTM